MAYLTNLADVARSAGLRVVETSGWKTRGHGGFGAVLSVVCHHTGTSAAAPGDYPSLNVVTKGRADLAGPLCNYGLGRDGTVYVVAAGVAWHAGDTINDAVYGNSHAVGIEAEGSGSAAWPDAQLDAYARLCKAIAKAFGFSTTRIQGHKEICYPHGRKVDPNFDMNAFRARVDGAGNPTPTEKDDDDMACSDVGGATAAGEWGELHVDLNGRQFLRVSSAYGRRVTLGGITMVDDTPAAGGSNGVTVQAAGYVDADRPGPWNLAKAHPSFANFSHLIIRYQSTGKVKAWVNDRA